MVLTEEIGEQSSISVMSHVGSSSSVELQKMKEILPSEMTYIPERYRNSLNA